MKKKGFTLIELMVVIVIIGILFGFLGNLYQNNINTNYTLELNNVFYKNIMDNVIVYNGNKDVDIPIYCKGGSSCNWDANNRCIIGNYDFDALNYKTLGYKKVYTNAIEYEICPKYKKVNNNPIEYDYVDKNDKTFRIKIKYNNKSMVEKFLLEG